MDIGAYISAGDIPVFRFSNGDSHTGPNLAPFTTFSTTSSVPEPSTWALTAAGALRERAAHRVPPPPPAPRATG